MPFTLVKAARAWWPVEWDGVAEDGAIVPNAIDMRFRLIKLDEAATFARDAITAQSKEQEDGADLAAIYAGLVARIADDWRHVNAENGDALPWTPDNLRLLMNEPGLFTVLFDAFRRCLAAAPKLRVGN